VKRWAIALGVLFASSIALAQPRPPQPHKFAQPPPHGSIRVTPHPTPSASASAESHDEHNEAAPEHEHELGPINWFDFSNAKQPPWGTYAINLALLLGIYWYYGKDAVKKGLKDRRERIKQEIDDAQRMLKEAETRAKKYQKKLGELDADVEQATRALVEAGGGERDRIVREAKEKAARMEREAHFLVEQDLKQMHQDIVRETLDATVAASAELIKKTLGPADHERLAEEYLQQLSTMKQLEVKRGEVTS
jgi:F-type H+-transporting ATPase subunit b